MDLQGGDWSSHGLLLGGNSVGPSRDLSTGGEVMGTSLSNPNDLGISAAHFRSNAQVSVIPLLFGRDGSSSPGVLSSQPVLTITVQLYPASVRQQWSLDISIYPKPRLLNPSTANAPNGHIKTFNGVQFQLPLTTLNHYADIHGLSRVSLEEHPKTYFCPVFMRLTHLLLSSIDCPDLVPKAFMDHFVTLFCAQVIHIQNAAMAGPIDRGGLTTWQKRRALEVLNQNLYGNVTLSTLAKECRLSVSHFARSFRVSFGVPVHQWVISQRLERAKDLLLNSNEPLIEIAFLAGFSDQASFNRTFAKAVGSSPGRWRRALKNS
jgi:AraC family transcriptional regulator